MEVTVFQLIPITARNTASVNTDCERVSARNMYIGNEK